MRHLDARNKGETAYDYQHDILIFKTKDRDYLKSLEYENFVVDIDREGFITGIQIFDASKTFKLQKFALKNIRHFEFSARFVDRVMNIRLRFAAVTRNRSRITQGQDFVREAIDTGLRNSETLASTAV